MIENIIFSRETTFHPKENWNCSFPVDTSSQENQHLPQHNREENNWENPLTPPETNYLFPYEVAIDACSSYEAKNCNSCPKL